MAVYSGFPDEKFDDVCIILDKMDKIGLDGVKKEFLEDGYSAEAVEKYVGLFEGMNAKLPGPKSLTGLSRNSRRPVLSQTTLFRISGAQLRR